MSFRDPDSFGFPHATMTTGAFFSQELKIPVPLVAISAIVSLFLTTM